MQNKIIIFIISVFVWIYTIITLPIYAIIQKPWKIKKSMSRKRAHQIHSSDGVCIRNSSDLSPIQLEMISSQLDTFPKVFRHSCRKNRNKRAFGWREVFGESDEVQQNGKVFKKLDMGKYQWITFAEAEEVARNFGNGLRQMGLTPNQKILMFAETRHEWLLAAMGAFMQRCAICTLYASLDGDSLAHSIIETEVEVIITTSALLAKVNAVLPNCPKIKSIITLNSGSKDSQIENDNSCEMWTFDEIVKRGKENTYEGCEPEPNDTAIIMYTSGSTGTPKGVMLSHKNITNGIIQMCPIIGFQPNDIYIAYLPLAHVLELLAESCMMILGIPMGYSTPLTLTDASSKIKKGHKGDSTVLKPTIMSSVPLILDRIYISAMEKIVSKGPLFKEIFDYFIQYRLSWFRAGWKTPLCNRIIFKKTRSLLGGNIRAVGCGGAPLSSATHDFIRAIFGINVCLGYGLTETSAVASMMDDVDDFSTGQSGAPLKLTYIKLVNWVDGGYTIDDKPNPRGEIVIGGLHVATGYFKNAALTAESFYEIDEQRWFRTGDIGEIFPDGTFHIVDRKKDIVKLQTGEYISLGKIESVLKLCPFVDNICIYGQSTDMNVVAVVSLNSMSLKSLEADLGAELNDEQGKDIIKAAVLKSLAECGKRANLSRIEIPTNCYLTEETWTPENKLVTTTMKIKRKNVELHYKEEIESLYSR